LPRRDLHRAEHADVDVTAADHRERLSGVEERRAGDRGDRLLAGVDEIGILVALDGKRPDPEQAVLALEHDVHAGWDEVRHQGRHPDPEVDVEAISELGSDSAGHLIAVHSLHG